MERMATTRWWSLRPGQSLAACILFASSCLFFYAGNLSSLTVNALDNIPSLPPTTITQSNTSRIMDKEAQQELAKQLAAQFASIRQGTSVASSATTSTSANSAKDANIAELASRLGTLMSQTPTTPPVQVQQTGTISFESVPDPSIYEQDFVNTYIEVNESVKQMEDRELLVWPSYISFSGSLFLRVLATSMELTHHCESTQTVHRISRATRCPSASSLKKQRSWLLSILRIT